MRPELPWAVAEDKSVSIQPARSLFISWGKTVQTNGATSESLFDYYLEPGSEHVPDSAHGARFKQLFTEAGAAYIETQKLVGPAAIFLSPRATTSLEELFKAHWNLATFSAICTHEYVEGASKLAEDAYDQVLCEAKAHLGITSDA